MFATTPEGLRIAYETRGSGPPIALVMGLGMHGAVWDDVRRGLVDEHTVLTYDNRGTGASDLPTKPYRMSDLGDDLARVLDAVGWDTAHVVGVSMGGMAAQEFALRHTSRVRSLTLIATHSGGLAAPIPKPQGLVRILQSRIGGAERRRKGMVRLLYPKGSGWSDSASVRTMVEGATNPRHRAAVQLQLRAVLTHRTADRLHTLAPIPTQVVRPGRDILCRPNNNDRLAAAIPGAVLRRFDEAGHGIIAQCADGLAEVIREQVRRVEG